MLCIDTIDVEVARLGELSGSEINDAKKILAFEATKLCHSEQAASDAAETAKKTFEQGGAGDNLPSITIPKTRLEDGMPFIDLLVETGLVSSKGEARRLIEGGGARCNDQPVATLTHAVGASDLTPEGYIKLSAGKKKHALIRPAA